MSPFSLPHTCVVFVTGFGKRRLSAASQSCGPRFAKTSGRLARSFQVPLEIDFVYPRKAGENGSISGIRLPTRPLDSHRKMFSKLPQNLAEGGRRDATLSTLQSGRSRRVGIERVEGTRHSPERKRLQV